MSDIYERLRALKASEGADPAVAPAAPSVAPAASIYDRLRAAQNGGELSVYDRLRAQAAPVDDATA